MPVWGRERVSGRADPDITGGYDIDFQDMACLATSRCGLMLNLLQISNGSECTVNITCASSVVGSWHLLYSGTGRFFTAGFHLGIFFGC